MRTHEGQARAINEEEFQRVIDTIRNQSHFIERDSAILAISFYAGLRAMEICALDWEDIIDARGELKQTITLRKEGTKGGKGGVAYLSHPVLRDHLSRLIVAKRSNDTTSCTPAPKFSGAVFLSRVNKRFSPSSMSQLFTRLYQLSGLEGATSHTGRRSLGRALNRKGVSVYNIQKILRHSNIQTTVRYIDVDEDLLSDIVSGL